MKTYLTTESKFTEKISVNKKTGEEKIITICNMKANINGFKMPVILFHLGPWMNYTNRSIAIKSVEDIHNQIYAQKLAETRARIGLYKDYKKTLIKACKEAKKEVEFLNSLIESVSNIITNEILYEGELLVNEEEFKEKMK